LLALATTAMWLEGGLIDHKTGEPPGYFDTLYFIIITITTVGYGDITPVETLTRVTDALLLTPIRFIVIFILFGTAYQFVFRRFQEEYRLKHIVDKLDCHTILCGFGGTGSAVAAELLLQGTPSDQIVAIDTDEIALQAATAMDVAAIKGDATREGVLKTVAIERAAHIIITAGRDDTSVLIALTALDLNPDCHIIAMCHEAENAKLLKRSGARTIVSSATAGGNLMAAATRRPHLAEVMEDLLSVGGALRLDERAVRPDEVGKHPHELPGISILRVYRGKERFDCVNFPKLQQGDILVYADGGTGE
jgi:voltage-gated potassium channel